MATSITVSYAQVTASRAFLTYLHNNWSKTINANDTYLIAAVASFFYAATAGGKSYQYNNPFKLYSANTTKTVINEDTGQRTTITIPGQLLRFKTLAEGFVAAAKALVAGATTPSTGYLLLLNALKQGGNQGAADFLAAIAMSSWQHAQMGVNNWIDAYNKDKNTLLSYYLRIKSVQLANPNASTRTAPPTPRAPKDHFSGMPSKSSYIDPWAAGSMYRGRHSARTSRASSTGR